MDTGEYQGFNVALHDPGIALVTFDRPERLNGMYGGMKRDLVELLLQAQLDDAVRVVVFTGTGRAFCAGDDMSGGYGDASRAPTKVPAAPPGHTDAIGTYDALRHIYNEAGSLSSVGFELAVLTAWAVLGFGVAIKAFRWQ